jgi:hypothetical protein
MEKLSSRRGDLRKRVVVKKEVFRPISRKNDYWFCG